MTILRHSDRPLKQSDRSAAARRGTHRSRRFVAAVAVLAAATAAVGFSSAASQDSHLIEVSETSLDITEGSSATFEVNLSSEPTHQVQIEVLSADTDAVSVQPAGLAFSSDDWDSPQTITVTAEQDDDTDNESVELTLTAFSSDPDYSGVEVSVTVAVAEDDDHLVVTPSTLSVEEGGTATFDVSLGTEPQADVTVTITSQDPSAVEVTQTSLSFTASNWDSAQTVTLTAQQDPNANDEPVTVLVRSASSDNGYQGLRFELTANTVDDEEASITVEPGHLGLIYGQHSTVQVELASKPDHDVTITISLSDTTAASVEWPNSGSITFTPSNWDTASPIDLEGGSREEIGSTDSGTQTVTLTATSDDEGYNNLTAEWTYRVGDAARLAAGAAEAGGLYASNPSEDMAVLGSPLDLWSDGEDVWVVTSQYDPTLGGHVTTIEVYTLTGESTNPRENHQPTKRISPEGNVGRGLWSDGTTMWVLRPIWGQTGQDADGGTIAAYKLDDGTRDSDKDIDLDSDNGDPAGLWSDGTTIWTTDNIDGKIYAYKLDDGTRDSDKDIDLLLDHPSGLKSLANASPMGLWSNGTTLWVTDRGQHAHAYTLATGAYDSDNSFNVDFHDVTDWRFQEPAGLWGNDSTVWIAAHQAGKIYAFNLTGTQTGGL